MESDKEKHDIDLSKILLPKKEGPSVDSAQRINAGALLNQEQSATLKSSAEPVVAKPHLPEQKSGPKPEESTTPSLQTYRGDIEQLVQKQNVSVVSIAAAEALRRGTTPSSTSAPPPTPKPSISSIVWQFRNRIVMIGTGVFFLAAAIGIATLLFLKAPSALPVEVSPLSPFLSVDDTVVLTLQPGELSRSTLMDALESSKENTTLSLGLIARFYVGIASSTATSQVPPLMSAQTLLSTLAPNLSQEFLRAVDPVQYLLGVHSFDEHQAFLILRMDSHEQAYSGMLSWERTMRGELAPLFTRNPAPHISTGITATSTATSTPQFIQTGFVDRVVENHDARVIQNATGDIILLWTFLDRNTIVITTNEYTLRGIIGRRNDALQLSQ
jgi:hypothetical protein